MFEKKENIFKKKDRETWQKIRLALREAGIKASAGHYQQDALMAGGCGSKLDPRNFGTGGRVDRDVYYIRVPAREAERAREVLHRKGLKAEVEDQETLMTDAAVLLAMKKGQA